MRSFGDDLTELYDELLIRGRTQRPHPELGWGLSPTTVRHVHTILHKAFADAIRWGLLYRNPCEQADPPGTAAVKARAQATRKVWSWEQLRRFIATIQGDRLYPMWHLFATTGMRRGEMAGLVWRYVDLDEGLISIVRNAVPVRGKVIEQDYPKSAKSRRAIEIDDIDVQALRAHRKRQAQERLAFGGAWADPERVFTTRVGGRLYPPDITKMFHHLTDEAGLPRIRLQDLRSHACDAAAQRRGETSRWSASGWGTARPRSPWTPTPPTSPGCSETRRGGSRLGCCGATTSKVRANR